MKYEVYSGKEVCINWNVKGNERIVQNVNNILNTIKFELPYDRLFGRDPKNIDKPLNKTRNAYIEETYDLINTYEPRAVVESVDIILRRDEFNDTIPILKVVISIDS